MTDLVIAGITFLDSDSHSTNQVPKSALEGPYKESMCLHFSIVKS